MKFQRTERHIIKNNKQLDNLCFLSKNLYNLTNCKLFNSFHNLGKQ